MKRWSHENAQCKTENNTMTVSIAGVIPARFGSTRFPGKPLALLHGRPLIVHVCEHAAAARRLNHFWVATDDERIAVAVRRAGYEARLTPSDCPSGTDRIVASLRGNDPWDILVNIQGDEPRIDPTVVDAVADALIASSDCGVATAAVPIRERADFDSPHVVKVVIRPDGQALYFSRSPLPSPARLDSTRLQAADFTWGLKHLGLYAYRLDVAYDFARWEPTPLELRERLEQLRFLEHGVGIHVVIVAHDSIGIDTPEELEQLMIREQTSSVASEAPH
jgi:3-deoxy-manno-octulosonate cytidylyltransferase (CMP-KDO synthetase)